MHMYMLRRFSVLTCLAIFHSALILFHDFEISDAVGESSYETLSFLASLAGSVQKRQSAVIGYGKLPPEQYLVSGIGLSFTEIA